MGACQSRQSVAGGGVDLDEALFQGVRRLRRRPSEQSVTIIPEVGDEYDCWQKQQQQNSNNNGELETSNHSRRSFNGGQKSYKLNQAPHNNQRSSRATNASSGRIGRNIQQSEKVAITLAVKQQKVNKIPQRQRSWRGQREAIVAASTVHTSDVVDATAANGNRRTNLTVSKRMTSLRKCTSPSTESEVTITMSSSEEQQSGLANSSILHNSVDETRTVVTADMTMTPGTSMDQNTSILRSHQQRVEAAAELMASRDKDSCFSGAIEKGDQPQDDGPSADKYDDDSDCTSTTSAPCSSVATGPQPFESASTPSSMLAPYVDSLDELDLGGPSDEESPSRKRKQQKNLIAHPIAFSVRKTEQDEIPHDEITVKSQSDTSEALDQLPPPPPPPLDVVENCNPNISSSRSLTSPGRLWMNKFKAKKNANKEKEKAVRMIAPKPPLAPMITPSPPDQSMKKIAVAPQTVSDFQRLRLQVKLQQQYSKKKEKINKVEDRIKDVEGYKKLWKEFQQMGDDVKSRCSSRNRESEDGESCTSFDLNDSSSWYFDFQGVDFAYEGKTSSQSNLSLLSAASLEAQRRIYKQKRRMRKHRMNQQSDDEEIDTGSRAATVSGKPSPIVTGFRPRKQDPVSDYNGYDSGSNMSAPADYGPPRKNATVRKSPDNIAHLANTPIDQLIQEAMAAHDPTDMEVDISKPSRFMDDASDIADDASRASSQLSSASYFNGSYSHCSYGGGGSVCYDYGVPRRQRNLTSSAKITALERRLQDLQQKNQSNQSAVTSEQQLPQEPEIQAGDTTRSGGKERGQLKVVALVYQSTDESVDQGEGNGDDDSGIMTPLSIYGKKKDSIGALAAAANNSTNPDLSVVVEENSPSSVSRGASQKSPGSSLPSPETVLDSSITSSTLEQTSTAAAITPMLDMRGKRNNLIPPSPSASDSLAETASPGKFVTSLMTSFNLTVLDNKECVSPSLPVMVSPGDRNESVDNSLLHDESQTVDAEEEDANESYEEIYSELMRDFSPSDDDNTCTGDKKELIQGSGNPRAAAGSSDPPGKKITDPVDCRLKCANMVEESPGASTITGPKPVPNRKAHYATLLKKMQPRLEAKSEHAWDEPAPTLPRIVQDCAVVTSANAQNELKHDNVKKIPTLVDPDGSIESKEELQLENQVEPAVKPKQIVVSSAQTDTARVFLGLSPLTVSASPSRVQNSPPRHCPTRLPTPRVPMPWVEELTTEQFFRLSDENPLERAARLERENFDELSDEADSVDVPPVVDSNKVEARNFMASCTSGVVEEEENRVVGGGKGNRSSLDMFRTVGPDDKELVNLAEQVEAQIQNVLAKYRGNPMDCDAPHDEK